MVARTPTTPPVIRPVHPGGVLPETRCEAWYEGEVYDAHRCRRKVGHPGSHRAWDVTGDRWEWA